MMPVTTSTKAGGEGTWQRRLVSALDARSLAVLVCDDSARRASLAHEVSLLLRESESYVPLPVPPYYHGRPVAFLRGVVEAAGLPASRNHDALWRSFKEFCLETYQTADRHRARRIVLLFEDAHLLTDAQLRLLHSFSTITCDNSDLAVQMVLTGQTNLRSKLKRDKHRALWSRVGARIQFSSVASSGKEATSPSSSQLAAEHQRHRL